MTNSDQRYIFDPKTIDRDRTVPNLQPKTPSYEDMIKMMQGEMPIPPNSDTQRDLAAAASGQVLLDNIWVPSENYTDDEWRSNLDDQTE
jgi:hypothetical protein